MQHQYKTLAEYRQRIPAFTCVRATENGVLTIHGNTFDVQEGQEIVLVDSDAKRFMEGTGELSDRQLKDVYRPYSGQNLNGKRLMVWRSGGIGDLLWLRPILCHLKSLYPESIISLATRSMFHEMVLLWNDCLDELSDVPMTMDDVARADYHFSFEGLVERCFDATDHDIHDLLAIHAGLDPDVIEWCCPMKLPRMLQDDKCYEFLRSVASLGKCGGGRYACVQYRASTPIRTPLFRTFVAAINAVTAHGYHVVIPETKAHAADIDNLISCCNNPELICNFAYHDSSLVDLVRLVNHAKLVIGPDSAQVHIAAMQGTPALGIYGPFPGKLRCSRYKKVRWVEPEPSRCCGFGGKYCLLPQYARCPANHACWRYMDNQKLGDIVSAFVKREVDAWWKHRLARY